jgi:hypothetical protein
VIASQNAATRPTWLVVFSPLRAKQEAGKRPRHNGLTDTVRTNEQICMGRMKRVAAEKFDDGAVTD